MNPVEAEIVQEQNRRRRVEEALKDAINRYGGVPHPITLDDGLMDVVDSLTRAEIVMALEDKFGHTVPDEEIDGWSITEIVDYFEKYA